MYFFRISKFNFRIRFSRSPKLYSQVCVVQHEDQYLRQTNGFLRTALARTSGAAPYASTAPRIAVGADAGWPASIPKWPGPGCIVMPGSKRAWREGRPERPHRFRPGATRRASRSHGAVEDAGSGRETSVLNAYAARRCEPGRRRRGSRPRRRGSLGHARTGDGRRPPAGRWSRSGSAGQQQMVNCRIPVSTAPGPELAGSAAVSNARGAEPVRSFGAAVRRGASA